MRLPWNSIGDNGTYINTMVSSSLSKQETDSIIKALEERNSDRDIGLGFSETGFGFRGNAKTSDVKNLVSKCRNNNK
jgi:UDP-glucose 6-dehydrogenase